MPGQGGSRQSKHFVKVNRSDGGGAGKFRVPCPLASESLVAYLRQTKMCPVCLFLYDVKNGSVDLTVANKNKTRRGGQRLLTHHPLFVSTFPVSFVPPG